MCLSVINFSIYNDGYKTYKINIYIIQTPVKTQTYICTGISLHFFHKYDPKAIDNEESMYEIACVCFPILIDSIQLKYI